MTCLHECVPDHVTVGMASKRRIVANVCADCQCVVLSYDGPSLSDRQVTDEMVTAALVAFLPAWRASVSDAMRAALEAVFKSC